MSKFFICLTLIFACAFLATAQQVPMLNQYYINKSVYNPSAIGVEGSLNAYLLHNTKFSSFEGGHVVNALNFDKSSPSKNYAIGINMMNESIGILNNTQLSFSYAYKLKLNDNAVFRLGLSVGLGDYRLNMTELMGDRNDPFFINKSFKKSEFIANVGMYFKSNNLNLSFTMPQLMDNIIDFRFGNSINSYKMKRTYLFFSEYYFNLDINNKFHFYPSLMMRISPSSPFQFDLNALFKYKKLAWFALSYRSNYSICFNVGYKLFNNLKVGYSHDLPFGKIASVSSLSNEILIGYTVSIPSEKKKKKIKMKIQRKFKGSDELLINKYIEEAPKVRKVGKDIESGNSTSINELYAVDLIVNEILFSEKKNEILTLSKKDVDLVEYKMKTNNHYILRMHAFTDIYDSTEKNMALIMKRFACIQNKLVQSGIEIQRIVRVPHFKNNEITTTRGQKIKLKHNVVYLEIFTY